MVHSDRALHVIFKVEDRFVLARHTRYQDPVSTDSCVELFVRPREDRGYFNFEISCGGTMLLYYIEDPTRTATGFVRYARVDEQAARDVSIFHSMPSIVDPEMDAEVTWSIQYDVPLGVMEHYTGPLGKLAGQKWTANFFKCADGSSHPHWAAWSAIGTELNFHQPRYFGLLELQG